MSDNSKIEWTDATWNPIRARVREDMVIRGREVPAGKWGYHCERVSLGCKNCYASTMNRRMLPAWGTGLDYAVPNREKIEIFLDEEELLKPLKWKKPRRIFVESMSDWCATFVTGEMRARIMAVAVLCPQHTFLFLTKRAKECAEYWEPRPRAARERIYNIAYGLSAIHGGSLRIELANVLLGFSAENQECFDERWAHMRKLPAAGWRVWCSAEPLLGQIDMKAALHGVTDGIPSLSWVVAGGESGPGARPMHPDWPRSLRDQCISAGVPFFFKQWGAYRPCAGDAELQQPFSILVDGTDKCGYYCDMDAGIHPDHGAAVMWRVGKKAAGRLLDGREWSQFTGEVL